MGGRGGSSGTKKSGSRDGGDGGGSSGKGATALKIAQAAAALGLSAAAVYGGYKFGAGLARAAHLGPIVVPEMAYRGRVRKAIRLAAEARLAGTKMLGHDPTRPLRGQQVKPASVLPVVNMTKSLAKLSDNVADGVFESAASAASASAKREAAYQGVRKMFVGALKDIAIGGIVQQTAKAGLRKLAQSRNAAHVNEDGSVTTKAGTFKSGKDFGVFIAAKEAGIKSVAVSIDGKKQKLRIKVK